MHSAAKAETAFQPVIRGLGKTSNFENLRLQKSWAPKGSTGSNGGPKILLFTTRPAQHNQLWVCAASSSSQLFEQLGLPGCGRASRNRLHVNRAVKRVVAAAPGRGFKPSFVQQSCCRSAGGAGASACLLRTLQCQMLLLLS